MTRCIDTIANLKKNSVPVLAEDKCVIVKGYYEPGDAGGGTFVWDEKSKEDDNGGTIIAPHFHITRITRKKREGRWKRQFTGPVDIRWFGASTSSYDNSAAIQRAIDTGHPIYIPYDGSKNAAFKFTRRLKLRPGTAITGGGRTVSILEFTGCGIAIDDVDYGPATHSILYGFKLQASDPASTIGIQMTNAKVVVLENLWIEGADSLGSQKAHWSIAGLSIRGGQGQGISDNTYDYRVLGCDISGCMGDGIFVKDDSGTGGLYVFHSRIQGCGGIGFNQEFGAGGPGHKCQVYVEGNDIEGNSGGQVNCDSLWGSTFKNNHLENQRLPDKPSIPVPKPCKIPPMSFGSRPVPKTISGTTTGKNTHFKIAERGTLTLNIDGGKDIKILFETGEVKLSDIISNINGATTPKVIALDSKGYLKLTSTKILDLESKRLTEVELQASQVVVSGSSCLLANLGLTAGIYNAHYDWNGQFFGLTVTGNVINSVSADWAIEFPSTSGSIGIVVSGNLITGPPDGRQKKPLAAIVSRSQLNMDISGNSCIGVFGETFGKQKDYAHYYSDWETWEKDSGYPTDCYDNWFSVPATSFRERLYIPDSFRGQDIDGHQFLGDLRFGITKITKTVTIDEHSLSIQDYDRYYGRSYSFHIKSDDPVSFPLPDHKIGKRVLFKNIGPGVATLISRKGTIDGMPTYTLPQYSFVELEDDGIDYWIIGNGRGGSSLVVGTPP